MKKKITPVVFVIVLIFLVTGAGILSAVIKRYMPSKEAMEATEYFQLTASDQVGLVIDHELKEEKVKIIDGAYYIEDFVVSSYINGRFYWDEAQQVMLYTLPEEEFQIFPEQTIYETSAGIQNTEYTIIKQIEGSFFLNLEFVGQYTDMEYEIYEDPTRIVIQTNWDSQQMVTAKKDGEIREKGGIKSTIVDQIEKEEQLYLIEELENWSKVATKDGYCGYIQKEKLSEAETYSVPHESKVPEYTNIQKDYKINLVWHQVTNAEGNAALSQVLANAVGVNTISPTWFSVIDNSGTISSLASAEYVNLAHSMGIEVWGLIDNFNENTDNLTLLSSTAARKNIIQQLMDQAAAVGLDGINLDFEAIQEEQAPHYVQFIRELSIACRKAGLVFSIDDPVPTYTKHYDRKEQGIVADYVIVMGYDEHHYGSTEAGSVASIGFVRDGVEETLKEVPANKVIQGIPFYTRVWIEPYGTGGLTSEALGMDRTTNYIAEHGMDTYWDEEVGQTIASSEEEDGIHTIWVEDEQSIGEKMKLVQEYQLAGVAAWKLGFERASIWPVIAQYLQ